MFFQFSFFLNAAAAAPRVTGITGTIATVAPHPLFSSVVDACVSGALVSVLVLLSVLALLLLMLLGSRACKSNQ